MLYVKPGTRAHPVVWQWTPTFWTQKIEVPASQSPHRFNHFTLIAQEVTTNKQTTKQTNKQMDGQYQQQPSWASAGPGYWTFWNINKLCGRPPQYAPAPCKLNFDLLTLKVVSESRGLPLCQFVFLGLSVLDLGPMYATDRQTHVRCASSLNDSYLRGGGIINTWSDLAKIACPDNSEHR